MQSKQALNPALVAEYIPQNYFQVLDLESVFPRRAPLEIDLGCGDGSFLIARAKQNPQRNFLGIERLLGRVRSACRKISVENLANARVLRIETSYAVAQLLPSNSVSVFYLLFPDPWPKRRHQHRRIVSEEFLKAIYRTLEPAGLLLIATDESEYFDEIQRQLEKAKRFASQSICDFDLPVTTFEKHFLKRGLEIHRLVLRKVSPVR